MHTKTLFLGVWKNTIWFFSFETLGRMHKFHFFQFVLYFWKFWRKPGILIPDLYFYDVKYRPILSKKIEKYTEKLQFFKKAFWEFFFNWAGPSSNVLGWAGFAGPFKQWVSPLFTCNVNSGDTNVNSGETRRRRRRRKGKGRRLT
jgi:hypothetical protein